eukprot:CAMPEP_0117670048 /NCGR_PEP_ID=MMETSP0804-20121206/12508_1 /TAXON_ID=1074897 /ORGANISM="Tetraselmis astigmatica, Strain CCMP880" /LENGTH=156 /DNA_ID=CAMNT_0005478247 /DNA_START=237 /DNA_END=707 /DNA_ORIENTATION=-
MKQVLASARALTKSGLSIAPRQPCRLVPQRTAGVRTNVKASSFDSLRQHPMFDPNAPKAKDLEEGKAEQAATDEGKAMPASIRVQATKGGRAGKTVSVITGLPKGDLKRLCKELKAQCGAGGSVKGDAVEIQGDHTDKLVTVLVSMGYKDTKKSGG